MILWRCWWSHQRRTWLCTHVRHRTHCQHQYHSGHSSSSRRTQQHTAAFDTLSGVRYASVTSKLTPDSVETYWYQWAVTAAGCCVVGLWWPITTVDHPPRSRLVGSHRLLVAGSCSRVLCMWLEVDANIDLTSDAWMKTGVRCHLKPNVNWIDSATETTMKLFDWWSDVLCRRRICRTLYTGT